MILNKSEAEAILSRIFRDETGGNVSIAANGNDLVANPENVIRTIMNQFGSHQNKIFCIKLYRTMVPGCGLADAKHAVEEVMRNL